MKKWGLLITLFYGFLVLALFVPATLLLIGESPRKDDYANWFPWACAGFVMFSEALLLWLTVGTTQKKLRPRTQILVSAVTTGLLLAILTLASVVAVDEAQPGKSFLDSGGVIPVLCAFFIPWFVWGILFYRLGRKSGDPVTRAVAWLFRGSVLELLIAVPSHVIVRRRHVCCAVGVTAIGIATGLVIMLVSFGPSVLLLYKKRMESYDRKTPENR
jgi:hypothetical protein